jgi:hypothetical protein
MTNSLAVFENFKIRRIYDVNLIGNLTILTDPMNRDCESKPFSEKKAFYCKSKYGIAKTLCDLPDWDENAIKKRKADLAEIAAKIWIIN